MFLCLVLTKKMQTLVGAPHGGAARCAVQAFRRRGNLGGGGIYFRRAFQIPTDTIKITTPFGVVISACRKSPANAGLFRLYEVK